MGTGLQRRSDSEHTALRKGRALTAAKVISESEANEERISWTSFSYSTGVLNKLVGQTGEDGGGGLAASDDDHREGGFDLAEAHLIVVGIVLQHRSHEIPALSFEIHTSVDLVDGLFEVVSLQFANAGRKEQEEDVLERRVVSRRCGESHS